MLKELDLRVSLPEEKWEEMDALKQRLGALQQRIRALKIPAVIVFEGWGAAGKGSQISKLINNLDPRGFSVYSIISPTESEKRYPWMRRFWKKLPLYGDISIFDRSWYREVTVAREESTLSEKEIERRFSDIREFEKQITDDGHVLLKFFLHISRKEQKRRFKALEEKKATRWRVTEQDWFRNEHYEQYEKLFDDMIERTDLENARWTVVEAEDKRWATYKIFTTVIAALENKIAQVESENLPEFAGIRVSPSIKSSPLPQLSEIDLEKRLEPDEYKQELKECQKRLFELHNKLYQKKIPMILAYEGWDAAGKGGNIKRITQALDPRGFEVVPIASPSFAEKNHHYLWRFWNTLPKDGHIAIFDRTWYGRVMVEHIEGFCTEEEWGRAYDEINHFERGLSDWGAVILKFWLHIDPDEQLRRFQERQNTPEKQYKITDEDWRNREKWDAYEAAVNEMLCRTNTKWAPWIVVESNDKKYARIKTMYTIIQALEKRLK